MRSKKSWKKCLELKGTPQQMEKWKCWRLLPTNSGGGGWGRGEEGRGVSTRLINTNKQLRLPHPHILTSMYAHFRFIFVFIQHILYKGYLGASVAVSASKSTKFSQPLAPYWADWFWISLSPSYACKLYKAFRTVDRVRSWVSWMKMAFILGLRSELKCTCNSQNISIRNTK